MRLGGLAVVRGDWKASKNKIVNILQGRKLVAFRALPCDLEVTLIFKGTKATFHPSSGAPRPV